MQLKICIKRSLAHILCSYAKKRCNFKQRSANNRQQTAQQALVLINEDQATSEDVIKLAHYVRQQVGAKFNVWLQPEVRFIGTHGEVNAEESIA